MSSQRTSANWTFISENGEEIDIEYFIQSRRGALLWQGCIDCINEIFERLGFQGEAREGNSVFIEIAASDVEALRLAIEIAEWFGQPIMAEIAANQALAQKYADAGFDCNVGTNGQILPIHLPKKIVPRAPLP